MPVPLADEVEKRSEAKGRVLSLTYLVGFGDNALPRVARENRGRDGRHDAIEIGAQIDVGRDILIAKEPRIDEPLEIDGLPLKIESNSLPFIADWDKDGGKDLLIGDDGGNLHLYLNSVVIGEPDLMVGEKVDRNDYTQVLVNELAIPYFIGMGLSKQVL